MLYVSFVISLSCNKLCVLQIVWSAVRLSAGTLHKAFCCQTYDIDSFRRKISVCTCCCQTTSAQSDGGTLNCNYTYDFLSEKKTLNRTGMGGNFYVCVLLDQNGEFSVCTCCQTSSAESYGGTLCVTICMFCCQKDWYVWRDFFMCTWCCQTNNIDSCWEVFCECMFLSDIYC